MRALAYTKILASVILITCHTNISVSYIEKNFRFFQGFIKNSNFADVALDYMSCPINAKQYGYQKCKINQIFQRNFFHFNLTTNSRRWISGKWAISNWVKGLKRLRYVLIWGYKMTKFSLILFFDILTSQEKSQLISAVCLHFFKKHINSKQFTLSSENSINVWKNLLFVYIFVLLHKSAQLLERWDISYWVDGLQRLR